MQKTSGFVSFFKSLRCRLVIWTILLAIVPSLLVGSCILFSYEMRALSIRESEVLNQARIIANQIASSTYMDGGKDSNDTLQAQMSMLTTIYDGRVLIVDDNFQIIYDTYNLDDNKTIISEEVIKSFKGEIKRSYDADNRYIEMSVPIIHPNDVTETVMGVLVVSVSTDNIQLNLSYLSQIANVVVFLVIIVASFAGVLMSLRLMKPFGKLSDDMANIQGSAADEALVVNDYTETIEICEKFNEIMNQVAIVAERWRSVHLLCTIASDS